MKFIDVDIKNFFSISHIHLNFENKGLVLVEGRNLDSESFQSNGSAKTSMLSSIVYALYNITLKDVSPDDIVNRKVGKDLSVILNFKIGDTEYRVERYRKHHTYKNKVRLFINNEDHTQSSAKLTNELIEKTVGIDKKTFLSAVFFGQGDIKLFSQATDKERKSILEELANLQVYNDAEELAKQNLKEEELTFSKLGQDKELLNRDMQQIEAVEKSEKEQYERIKSSFSDYEKKISSIAEQMKKFKKDNEYSVEQDKELLSDLKDKISHASHDYQQQYESCLEKESHSLSLLKSTGHDLKSVKQEIITLNDQIDSLSSAKICPVCGNPIDDDHIKKEKSRLAYVAQNKIAQYSQLKDQVNQYNKEYKFYSDKLYRLGKLRDAESVQYNHFTAGYTEAQKRISDYTNKLYSYQQNYKYAIDNYNKFKSLPVPQPKEEERKTIKAKMDDLQSKLQQCAKDIDEYKQVVKVYSNQGVKSHVLDLITPYLNKQANKYISELSGSGIEIELSTQTKNKDGSLSDKFDVKIHNYFGGDSYESCSQGERRRVDLAISLAIQDLLMSRSNLKTNVIFYDECFDGLDEVGCERVVELLNKRLTKVPSIFVITHNSHLKGLFDNTITVVKKNGISTIGGKTDED